MFLLIAIAVIPKRVDFIPKVKRFLSSLLLLRQRNLQYNGEEKIKIWKLINYHPLKPKV